MPEKKDFIIKDKRVFSEEGQDSKETEERKDSPKEDIQEEVSQEDIESQETEHDYQMPEITFSTFIFSLNTSVLVHLGVIEDPATGEKGKNLPIAKQTIDILSMLEQKTAGNLTDEEQNLLKNILYDLRLMYVKEKG